MNSNTPFSNELVTYLCNKPMLFWKKKQNTKMRRLTENKWQSFVKCGEQTTTCWGLQRHWSLVNPSYSAQSDLPLSDFDRITQLESGWRCRGGKNDGSCYTVHYISFSLPLTPITVFSSLFSALPPYILSTLFLLSLSNQNLFFSFSLWDPKEIFSFLFHPVSCTQSRFSLAFL